MLPLGPRKEMKEVPETRLDLLGGNAMGGDVPPSLGWSLSQVGFKKRPHVRLREGYRGCFCYTWCATPPAQQSTDWVQPLT